jgi:hypothetical protein
MAKEEPNSGTAESLLLKVLLASGVYSKGKATKFNA